MDALEANRVLQGVDQAGLDALLTELRSNGGWVPKVRDMARDMMINEMGADPSIAELRLEALSVLMESGNG
ncbi:MAG: hypothetical protein IT488_10460 [Gammaproteobacteria bacterium]|nr:hypothetical protein [Gammaproteobacteria bacterium]